MRVRVRYGRERHACGRFGRARFHRRRCHGRRGCGRWREAATSAAAAAAVNCLAGLASPRLPHARHVQRRGRGRIPVCR
jgi:hypothetical protein